MSISTLALTTGSVVLTTEPVGADFGIPLVAPTHRPDERGVVERTAWKARPPAE